MRVQRRATRLVKGLEGISREEQNFGFVWFGEKEAEGQSHCSPQLPEQRTWRKRC